MNGDNELIRKWLWMECMNYALKQLKWHVKPILYPTEKENEWKFERWEEMQKNIFTYVLEHWPNVTYSGSCSGHSRYDIGCWLDSRASSVTAEYKNMTVEIKWPEVRRFIEKMLDPDMEDRQIDLLELLSMNAG